MPPSQAETMVRALRAKGLPVAYVPFESELYSCSRVFGFVLADPVDPSRSRTCKVICFSQH